MKLESLSGLADWAMDRTVVPGYTKLGYKLRGLDGSSPDPDGRLEGSTVLVTGANSGLGYATTRKLASLGTRVVMGVRNEQKGTEALERIKRETGSDQLELQLIDLADLSSVGAAAASLRGRLDSLDALVHNAGLMTSERERSADGYELTLAVHVLGPLLLTHGLVPLLETAAPSRVIFVTSGGMYFEKLRGDDLQLERREFSGSSFYAHAKRLQVICTEILDQKLPAGVTVHAMHPGWAGTPGIERSLPTFNKVLGPLLRDPEAGADTTVWLCAADEPLSKSGRLWMDRRPRPSHRLPWTKAEPGERERAYEELMEMATGEGD